MDDSKRTSYDEVLYPNGIFSQTHPNRLATIATLLGMKPARVERCRVLELGCGDGGNLIPMAFVLPESEFYGIDLASRPIESGHRLVRELGLTNVTLRCLDIRDLPGDWGQFDFIIAHGIYSWVPADVRDSILATCGRHLGPQGVGYVSYNTYPGNYLRDIVRGIMRFHTEQFSDPMEKVRQSRALVAFLADAKPNPGFWQNLLKLQSERIARYVDAGVFHDDLSPINQSVYFHQFVEHATRHGLRYLAEADLSDSQAFGFTDQVSELMTRLEQTDVIAREQYLDFLRGRSFRQTLLCRQEIVPDRQLKPERAFDLYVAADSRRSPADANSLRPEMEDFEGQKGAVIATSHPVAKAALVRLGAAWPRHIHFRDLLAQARADAGRTGESGNPTLEEDANDLGEFLIRSHAVGFVELHAFAPSYVTAVSAFPTASLLARTQINYVTVVASMRHTPIKLADTLSQHLLRRLDGTRDRNGLLRELTELVRTGAAVPERDGQPVTNLDEALDLLRSGIDANLAHLARAGVLVG